MSVSITQLANKTVISLAPEDTGYIRAEARDVFEFVCSMVTSGKFANDTARRALAFLSRAYGVKGIEIKDRGQLALSTISDISGPFYYVAKRWVRDISVTDNAAIDDCLNTLMREGKHIEQFEEPVPATLFDLFIGKEADRQVADDRQMNFAF